MLNPVEKFYSLYFDKLPVKEKVNIFYNFRGGTGKTTICFQIAAMLALCGFNVLVIDLDPQAHLTNVLSLINTEIERL